MGIGGGVTNGDSEGLSEPIYIAITELPMVDVEQGLRHELECVLL